MSLAVLGALASSNKYNIFLDGNKNNLQFIGYYWTGTSDHYEGVDISDFDAIKSTYILWDRAYYVSEDHKAYSHLFAVKQLNFARYKKCRVELNVVSNPSSLYFNYTTQAPYVGSILGQIGFVNPNKSVALASGLQTVEFDISDISAEGYPGLYVEYNSNVDPNWRINKWQFI